MWFYYNKCKLIHFKQLLLYIKSSMFRWISFKGVSPETYFCNSIARLVWEKNSVRVVVDISYIFRFCLNISNSNEDTTFALETQHRISRNLYWFCVYLSTVLAIRNGSDLIMGHTLASSFSTLYPWVRIIELLQVSVTILQFLHNWALYTNETMG